MASLSIRCGGNNLNLRRLSYVNPPDQNARFSSLTISNHSRKQRGISMEAAATVRATATAVDNSRLHLEPTGKSKGIENESIGYEKIDKWMRESVNEIVKNLREAPLLVQVFSENNGTTTKMKTEKAVVDEWPIIKGKWKDGETQSPEGVILVEELKDDDSEEEKDEERGMSRAWGIVIQGKGVELGPACYLLKTSRVRSSLGLCCTHFCLVRVKSFRESAESQLTNCWL